MWHKIRMAIAVFDWRLAVDRVCDNPGRGERDHALDLREIDELPLAGEFCMDQRDQRRRTAVQAADGVAERGMAHDRRTEGSPTTLGRPEPCSSVEP